MTAWGHFRGGVGYTRDGGWYTIKQVNMGADRTGPTINVTASASITPSVKFRLAFLVYSVAGPFIEFEPYVTATITYTFSYTWEIKIGFKITAGCTFAGWLKTLLGLDDYGATLGDWQLARWSGTGQQPPVACFALSDYWPTVCSAVTFDATSSYDPDGTIVKYEWDWEGDCTYDFDAGNDPIAYHHYVTYGWYFPKLMVTDNDGLTSETQRFIWARQHPVACFIWEPEKPCMHECWPTVGENVTFDASCSTPEGGVILTYEWDFGDGTSDTGQILPHQYDTCGDYTVTLTVLDSEWLSASISKTIHIRAPPHASFTYSPHELYAPGTGEVVTFDASASTPNCGYFVNYTWNFGDTTPAVTESGPITTHIFTTHGTYNVTLTVFDSEDLNDTAWQLVTVTTHDVAVVDVTPESNWLYQGKLCRANINVTVCNEGDVPETFNVTLYYNITAGQTIGIQTVTNLPSGNCTTLTFLWDTTDVTPCHNYTITAVADTVPHEADTVDNTLESPTKIKVRLLGDVNDDGKVDIRDIARAALAFGSYREPFVHPRWEMYDSETDVDNNGRVDIRDLATIAKNFGTCL